MQASRLPYIYHNLIRLCSDNKCNNKCNFQIHLFASCDATVRRAGKSRIIDNEPHIIVRYLSISWSLTPPAKALADLFVPRVALAMILTLMSLPLRLRLLCDLVNLHPTGLRRKKKFSFNFCVIISRLLVMVASKQRPSPMLVCISRNNSNNNRVLRRHHQSAGPNGILYVPAFIICNAWWD